MWHRFQGKFRWKEANWLYPVMEFDYYICVVLLLASKHGDLSSVIPPWLSIQLSPLTGLGAKGSASSQLCLSFWQGLFLWFHACFNPGCEEEPPHPLGAQLAGTFKASTRYSEMVAEVAESKDV